MNPLVQQTEIFVRETVRTRFPAALSFHNILHFEAVARNAEELARVAGLEEEDALALILAGWGHDLGYAEGAEGHEERSVQLMTVFLTEHGATAALTEKVGAAIMATRAKAKPANELERLMKDADLAHIGSVNYSERLALLRSEREALTGVRYTAKDWLAQNIAFLERTMFHSTTAQKLWEEQRIRNLNTLKAMQDEKDKKDIPEEGHHHHHPTDPEKEAEKAEKKAKKKEREKFKETERGVDTLFRVTLANHMRLSQVADRKAGTLLSVNALIISISMSRLTPKVSQHPELYMPLFLLMAVCVLTIIFATLATRPKITHGVTSKEAIARKEANLLFFGNFHSMDLDEFQDGMRVVMEDRDYLYGSLTRDLYGLGRVLDRKYRLLRITYNIFMFGMIGVVGIMIYVTMVLGTSF